MHVVSKSKVTGSNLKKVLIKGLIFSSSFSNLVRMLVLMIYWSNLIMGVAGEKKVTMSNIHVLSGERFKAFFASCFFQ